MQIFTGEGCHQNIGSSLILIGQKETIPKVFSTDVMKKLQWTVKLKINDSKGVHDTLTDKDFFEWHT